jgi:hypothetical protein
MIYECGWTRYQVQGKAAMPCIMDRIAEVSFALIPSESINFSPKKKSICHQNLKAFFTFDNLLFLFLTIQRHLIRQHLLQKCAIMCKKREVREREREKGGER